MAVPDRIDNAGGLPVVWAGAHSKRWDTNQLPIDLIIVHDIEGSAESAVGLFQTDPAPADPKGSGGSTHFVVDQVNRRIVQCVGLRAVAYGCGNYFHNQRAWQIEHPGFVGRPYDPTVVNMGAQLAGFLAAQANVPVVFLGLADNRANKRGITGHEFIPDPNNPSVGGGRDHHTDPGPTWPWAAFLNGVAAAKGGSPVVDAGELRFPVTGYSVRFGFAAYWNHFGGLASLGYPISREFIDRATGLTVQYFERARLEWHPGSGVPFDVMPGRVGAELLDQRRQAGAIPPAALQREY